MKSNSKIKSTHKTQNLVKYCFITISGVHLLHYVQERGYQFETCLGTKKIEPIDSFQCRFNHSYGACMKFRLARIVTGPLPPHPKICCSVSAFDVIDKVLNEVKFIRGKHNLKRRIITG